MKKVVVLGGGFAGLETAIFLKKYGFSVDLVSNREYMYVYPISIWIPTDEIKFDDVKIDFTKLSQVHKFNFFNDEIVEIKAEEKKAIGKSGREYSGDYLVIAMGATKMKPKGIENTLSICGAPEEALKIKEKIDKLIKEGNGKLAFGFGGNPKDPSAVRGGPAFEVMFNVHNKLKKLGIRDKFEITFFAPMPKPGARMGEKALKMMDIMFEKMNIKKVVGKKIKEFVADGVIFEDDSKLETDFTMFIPAGVGLPVYKQSNLPVNDANFIKINKYCEVEGLDGVYAVGDAATIEGPDWKAKQGHLAEVMAKATAYNISQKEKGSSNKQDYTSHINILCVMDTGDGAAFVYRDDKKAKMIPMPIIGHIMKKGWGWYYKNSKLNKIPRLPGL